MTLWFPQKMGRNTKVYKSLCIIRASSLPCGVAQEVASQLRIADEVVLGKTIEAGLIRGALHEQPNESHATMPEVAIQGEMWCLFLPTVHFVKH